MSLYVHLPFTVNAAQEKNLILLARYLLIHGDDLMAKGLFDVGAQCTTEEDGWEPRPLTPHQAYVHIGPVVAGPIGFGPIAGVTPLPGEDDWDIYCARAFGLKRDEPAWEWAIGTGWRHTDLRPRGAALRMMYLLDYAVPNDWEALMGGRGECDYDDNGFLFDRVGLMDPRYEKPKYDIPSAPAHVTRASLLSRLRHWLKGTH